MLLTRTAHRSVLAAIAAVALSLTPLIVLRVVPSYVGVGLFVILVIWIAIGLRASRKHSRPRAEKTTPIR